MDALWFMGYVRNIGEGTRRMQVLMQQSSLPAPEFRQKEIGHSVVRVTLRNNYAQRKELIDSAVASSIISPEISKTLSDHERMVVNHLAEHNTIDTSQTSRITGRGWKSAHRLLMKMAARNILIHNHRRDIERDPDAHFVLAPKVIAKPDSAEKG